MNDSPDQGPRPVALLIVAAILAAVIVLFAMRAPSTMASFREVLEGFGATIPPTTLMVLNAPYAWSVLAGASVALFAWVAAKSRTTAAERKRMKWALSALVILAVLAYAFAAYWLYLPIYAMGESV